MPKMRIFWKQSCKIVAASGIRSRTLVDLWRCEIGSQTPVLLLSPIDISLSYAFLALNAFYYHEK